jgi:hypothetical protein
LRQRREVRGERRFAALPAGAQHVGQRLLLQPDARTGQAERDHVDPAATGRFRELLERQRHEPRAAGQQRGRRFAGVAVTDDQPARTERQFVGKALQVLPIKGHQQVESVVQRRQRCITQSQQRRGLAAADLRAARAHHQAEQAGARRRVEQQLAGRHHAGAAAAGNGHRVAVWMRVGSGHGKESCSLACRGVDRRPLRPSLL